MSQPARVLKSDSVTEDVSREVLDLVALAQQLPPEQQGKIEPALARVVEATKRRRRILSLVQDALGQLRLDMKYLAFDLEATRRERDDFRRKWEQTQQ